MRTIAQILDEAVTIAIVGASPRPDRASYTVAESLKQRGFRIIPVNPAAEVILGEPVRRSLAEINERVDIVDVFRRSEDTPDVARDAAAIGAGTLWLQLGITSDESRAIAESAGLDYVEDRCLKIEAAVRGIDKRAHE
jgi:hypothetical protein